MINLTFVSRSLKGRCYGNQFNYARRGGLTLDFVIHFVVLLSVPKYFDFTFFRFLKKTLLKNAFVLTFFFKIQKKTIL